MTRPRARRESRTPRRRLNRAWCRSNRRSEEAIEAAKVTQHTPWATDFKPQGDGVYGADPLHPRGAVAYTDEAMRRMIDASGLKLKRPYVKGWWSGLYSDAEAEDGQDAAILGR